jgi:hypothetical protein
LAGSRKSQEGQQIKMELVYAYLTGPRFRHRIDAIVEKFTDMQTDLDRERKTMIRMLWAKREAQLRGVLDSTPASTASSRASLAAPCRRSEPGYLND